MKAMQSKWALGLIFTLALPAFSADVLTQHNNNFRTGAMLEETQLNSSNVNVSQFGQLFSRVVDGQMYAQPLIVSNLGIAGKRANVVILATMRNTVYAFDAEDPQASTPYWKVNLGPAVPTTDFDPPGGNLSDTIGIVSTPVIDRASNAIYLVALTKENGNYIHRLHALDLTTGAEKAGSPVAISGSVPGSGDGSVNGVVAFASRWHLQRPAITLTNGVIYVGFASHEDDRPYHGWLFAYNATNLQRVGIYNSSPNSAGSGFWQSGQGFAVDEDGYIYGVTGNGFGANPTLANDRSESVVKFQLTSSGIQLRDWFTPVNWQNLDDTDDDLGVGGTLLIPGTKLVMTGSKRGNLYLMNRENMGRLSNTGVDQIVQQFHASQAHIHGSPTVWQGPFGTWLYVMGEGSPLRAYALNNGLFNTTPVSESQVSAISGAMPGGFPSLSANGSQSGSGVVWINMVRDGDALHDVRPGILRAYDANDLHRELWNSQQNQSRDDFGAFAKFVPPTVANGKVYMSTFSNRLVVYGLLNGSTIAPPGPLLGQIRLISQYSGKCLDLTNGSTASGNTVTQLDCVPGTSRQTWTVQTNAQGQYRFVNNASGLCMTNASNGTITQVACSTTAANQLWVTSAGNDGSFHLSSVANQQCLDVSGVNWNNNAAIISYACHQQINQRWRAEQVNPINGDYALIVKHSGQCLDVPSHSTAPNTQMIQWPCWGGLNQTWTIQALNSIEYKIVSKENGFCLSVGAPAADAGAPVTQTACAPSPTATQRWTLEPQSDGTFHILSANSKQCLDISGASQNQGTVALQWTCHSGLNQRWTLQKK